MLSCFGKSVQQTLFKLQFCVHFFTSSVSTRIFLHTYRLKDWISIIEKFVGYFSSVFYRKLSNIIFFQTMFSSSFPVREKSHAWKLKICPCTESVVLLFLDVAAETFSWVLHCQGLSWSIWECSAFCLCVEIQKHLGHKWPRESCWLKGQDMLLCIREAHTPAGCCGQNIQNKISAIRSIGSSWVDIRSNCSLSEPLTTGSDWQRFSGLNRSNGLGAVGLHI